MLCTESDLDVDAGPEPAGVAEPGGKGEAVLQPDPGAARRHAGGADRRRKDHRQDHTAEGPRAAAHHTATGRQPGWTQAGHLCGRLLYFILLIFYGHKQNFLFFD